MRLIIHRGAKAIGGNCVELIIGESRILLDFGMPLVDEEGESFDSKAATNGKSIEELKASKLLPDIEGLYKEQEKGIDAVFITHSHQDHYGLLKYINPQIPVYMSRGARELIDVIDVFIQTGFDAKNYRTLKSREPFVTGPFTVTPSLVDHSGFDAFSYLIEAKGKRLFYSGDFRGHGRKSKLLDAMIANPPGNIDCLMMEGSMLGRGKLKYKDEQAVSERIEQILKDSKQVTFLFCSGQNIDRIVSAYKACLRTDSIFVIDLYSAFVLHKLKDISKHLPQFDWRNIRVKFTQYHADALVRAGLKKLLYVFNPRRIDMPEINENKSRIMMLARDNSIFPKLVKNIDDIEGAILIHSMWEGYLSDELRQFCEDKGLLIEQVHISGHAKIEDLERFVDALKPKMLVPIHTFDSERFPVLFDNVKLFEDGQEFEL
ncbi:MAG: MBL fold metallo-hydrolase [Planctomycetota bacterium]|jgi:ribonuclease J